MRRKQQFYALLCGLALWLSGGAVWALQTHSLQGIELTSTPIETKVVLLSNTRIPYRVISKNTEKITIDLETVDPRQSIPTDFSDASNVEQVILKPVAENKVRLVIRGEKLASPIVLSQGVIAQKARDRKVVFEGEAEQQQPKRSKINAPDDNGFAMTSLSEEPQAQETQTETESSANPEESESPLAMAAFRESEQPELDSYVNEEELDLDSRMPLLNAEGDRDAMIDADAAEDTTLLDNQPATWQDLLISKIEAYLPLAQKVVNTTDKGILFQVLAFSGVFVLLGVFLRRKMLQASYQAFEDEDDAYAYENARQRGGRDNRRAPFTGYDLSPPERPQGVSSRRPSERPVGLRGLSGQHALEQPAYANKGHMVNRNQAINQYAQNAIPPVSNKPSRNPRELDQELQRSVQIKQVVSKTHTRKPPAQTVSNNRPKTVAPPPRQSGISPKTSPFQERDTVNRAPVNRSQPPIQPKAQSHLPQPRSQDKGLPANNTEVLEFLRSVADLMEKDGRPDLANGVKKGMIPRKQF